MLPDDDLVVTAAEKHHITELNTSGKARSTAHSDFAQRRATTHFRTNFNAPQLRGLPTSF
jgi:hypothetical protein